MKFQLGPITVKVLIGTIYELKREAYSLTL